MAVDLGMLAGLFYRQLEQIDKEGTSYTDKVERLRQLLPLLFVELTRRERFHFSTLFARIAYVAQTYRLDGELCFYLHHFRRQAGSPGKESTPEELFRLGLRVMHDCVWKVTGTRPSPENELDIATDWPVSFQPARVQGFRRRVRVLALRDDPVARQFVARDEDRPGEECRVQYDIADRNDNFKDTIVLIRKVFGLPLSLNLIDVEIDADGIYRPRAFVVEPDYLVDVSAIAECYDADGPEPMRFLLKRFLPFENKPALVLGNIANFFLDELLGDPDLRFEQLFPAVFGLYPLKFCLFNDGEIRQIMQKAYGHYQHLRQVIKQVFPEEGIDATGSQLEPTFYSEKYGLQGRLDLYYQKEERRAIVELKSGKVYRPNHLGLAVNHYTQTLLYDLLIRSVAEESGRKADPHNYILYSGQEGNNLRYAPRSQAHQMDALQVRNMMIAIEAWLGDLGLNEKDLLAQGDPLFSRLRPARLPGAKGFFRDDLLRFTQVLSSLDDIERRYFYAFSGFIAREHRLAKTGTQGSERNNGQSSLWMDDYAEKENAFSVLRNLEVAENRSDKNEPVLIFRRSAQTNPLANFRSGDIAVLYPAESDDHRAPLMHQVFKGTLIEMEGNTISFRLRSRQFDRQIFHTFRYWNLEPDLLDSSFTGLYRGLFAFASSPADRRKLWLGRRPPGRPSHSVDIDFPGLTPEQGRILERMVHCEDYFLLWGPPGTGKTRVMLRSLVAYLFRHSGERILLLAYTNRAVDEICAALDSIEAEGMDYLRIGSRYSTGARFRSRLLKEKLADITTRQALRDLITSFRIVVGTVSSLANKPELFQLQPFDRVVVDEASQILEPSLMGVLPAIPRVILIGDHKQLPAVVVQEPDQSRVKDKELQEIGVRDLRNALFERMYMRCVDMGWTWAFAQLRCQGRMHQEIMRFPGEAFYENGLEILPESLSASRRQVQPIPFGENDTGDPLAKVLLSRRTLFLPTPVDLQGDSPKTNRYEARGVVRIAQWFLERFQREGKKLLPDSIGVITPYRAQIAQIRKEMERAGLPLESISVDTVERYQGGARDVILLSLCTNSFNQLSSLISLSEEGVDRKLNVALTRAREHLVILGNAELLNGNTVYADLIRRYKVPGFSWAAEASQNISG